MKIEFDSIKAAENLTKHGVSFDAVLDFQWETAVTVQDPRIMSETRYISYGYVGIRLHVLVWTKRDVMLRVISFRKANRREIIRYEQSR